jgi:hypothetical protein
MTVKAIKFTFAAALVAAMIAPSSDAGGRHPGSVLVFPVHRSGKQDDTASKTYWWTVLQVVNSDRTPETKTSVGGSTNLHYQYVNVTAGEKELLPEWCQIYNRTDPVTPADLRTVLTTCHNATFGLQEGYVVVSAEDPEATGNVRWIHDYLFGTALVLNASGGMYEVNAIPFSAKLTMEDIRHQPYDTGNGLIDFDGIEVEKVPDVLMMDFISLAGSQLSLLNLTGGPTATVTTQLEIWNDNEFMMSQTFNFRCWFDADLRSVSPAFEDFFLNQNAPEDEGELDLDCDENDDVECGWIRIWGIVANSPVNGATPRPALLGAKTSGPSPYEKAFFINGGDLLWEYNVANGELPGPVTNGVFLDF